MDKKRLILYPILLVLTVVLATYGLTSWSTSSLLLPLLVTWLYFTGIFVVATKIKDNSIVDVGWGFGFVLGAWTSLLLTQQASPLSYILVAFISLWGLRLTLRLVKRNWGRPEDFRYANWRQEWGDKVVVIAFFRVFLIQWIINFTVGAPVYAMIMAGLTSPSLWTSLVIGFGLMIAVLGLGFEVIGDEQLRRHIQQQTGSLLQTGLWSLTRHPNYFGEILIWWGLYLAGFCLVLTGQVSLFYYGLLVLSPAIMTLVLIKVSTPLLEQHMAKYEGWEAYTKRVPMIFPFGKSS